LNLSVYCLDIFFFGLGRLRCDGVAEGCLWLTDACDISPAGSLLDILLLSVAGYRIDGLKTVCLALLGYL
jgi:hypothetical protein